MIPSQFFRDILEEQARAVWKLALCTAHQGATFDPDLEASGAGYPAGGAVLPAPRVEAEGRKLFLVFAPETVFEGTTIEASHCCVYAGGSGRVAVTLEFIEPQASRNGPFRVLLPRDAFAVRV